MLTWHVTRKEGRRVGGVRTRFLQEAGECRVVKMQRGHQIYLPSRARAV